METVIKLENREIKLKAAASFALRYRSYFGKDVLSIVMPIFEKLAPLLQDVDLTKVEAEHLKNLIGIFKNFELVELFNIVWVLAKTADKEIPEPMEWLDSFETFPLDEILPVAFKLLSETFISVKSASTTPSFVASVLQG